MVRTNKKPCCPVSILYLIMRIREFWTFESKHHKHNCNTKLDEYYESKLTIMKTNIKMQLIK